MILGLDISTSITGFAVIAEGQIVYYDSVDLRKEKDIFSKALAVKEKLLDIFEAYQCGNEDAHVYWCGYDCNSSVVLLNSTQQSLY